jgi:3-hydroxyisobutyrate dehydrogenase-like beta-hydroxyacid dehydrogenase
MGEVFAQRLIDARIPVAGFDIDPARRARLAQIGGHPADSVADLAAPSRCIMLAVFNTEQVEDVIERQLLPALGENSNKIVLCLSTCDPDRVAALAERVAPRGIRYLDVPISGTSDQVKRGDGVGLIGGDQRIADEVRPVLNALFSRSFHVGKIGDGGRVKLAVNLILALNRLALAEGLVFAERIGLDPAAFLEVARASASYSQVMDTKGRKMVQGDFVPDARIKQTLKDARLMLDKAADVGQRLRMLELHAAMCAACLDAGEGELDNSVVIKEVRRQIRN